MNNEGGRKQAFFLFCKKMHTFTHSDWNGKFVVTQVRDFTVAQRRLFGLAGNRFTQCGRIGLADVGSAEEIINACIIEIS